MDSHSLRLCHHLSRTRPLRRLLGWSPSQPSSGRGWSCITWQTAIRTRIRTRIRTQTIESWPIRLNVQLCVLWEEAGAPGERKHTHSHAGNDRYTSASFLHERLFNLEEKKVRKNNFPESSRSSVLILRLRFLRVRRALYLATRLNCSAMHSSSSPPQYERQP